MSRRWLVVLDDPRSEFASPEELESYLNNLILGDLGACTIARVQRGGLLADKVMAELPPVRHKLMGRARG
jgi:hypothetical protein